MVTMDRKDWQRSLQIKQTQYFGSANAESGNIVTIDSRVSPAKFDDVGNMHAFV